MPKGGELHIHSLGTARAEDTLRWATQRGFCGATQPVALVPPPCNERETGLAGSASASVKAALTTALTEAGERGPVRPRHDHFFATFGVAMPVVLQSRDEELALLRSTEAAQSVSYVEFMSNPSAVTAFGKAAAAAPFDPDQLDRAFDRLAPLLPGMLEQSRQEIETRWRNVDRLQGCGLPAGAPPPCAVDVRFLAFVTRNDQPADVFGQLVAAFYLAQHSPWYVGINIVGPEDERVALRYYQLHLQMLQYLRTKFPDVPMSLHAGELTSAVASPSALRLHIAAAVDAGARRIGHGVDIAGEAGALSTLALMARRRVALEANLTSNAVTLGISGRAHPLHRYLAAGVPVVLSTDDPGVLRTDLTREYLRAVQEQRLDYRQLKRLARNALEYAFVPGDGIWEAGSPGNSGPACADDLRLERGPSGSCAALLQGSRKARLQWDLERRFAAFENEVVRSPRLID